MEEPPERQVKNFRFKEMRRVSLGKARWPELMSGPLNLVATANKFGLIFATADNGFCVMKTTALEAYDEAAADFRLQPFTVQTAGTAPSHLALSSDDLTLAVLIRKDGRNVIVLYEVASFKNTKPTPFYQNTISKDIPVICIQWNPGHPQLLAVCFSNGSVSLLQVNSQIGVVASLPPTTEACSMCWSPKGKQLAIGHRTGTITQYSQELKPKKVIPLPSCFSGHRPIVSLVWISTYVYGAVYAGDGAVPSFVVLSMPRDATQPEVTNFDDIYMTCGQRTEQHFFKYIADWNVLLTASSNAAEVFVVSQQEEKDKKKLWERWDLDDDARAEIPLYQGGDMFPVGMAFETTSQVQISISETVTLPPCPILLLMSTSGELCPFRVIYQTEPMKVLTQPAVPLPAEERYSAKTISPSKEKDKSSVPQSSSGMLAASQQAQSTELLGSLPSSTGNLGNLSQGTAMKQGLFGLQPPKADAINKSMSVQSTSKQQMNVGRMSLLSSEPVPQQLQRTVAVSANSTGQQQSVAPALSTGHQQPVVSRSITSLQQPSSFPVSQSGVTAPKASIGNPSELLSSTNLVLPSTSPGVAPPAVSATQSQPSLPPLHSEPTSTTKPLLSLFSSSPSVHFQGTKHPSVSLSPPTRDGKPIPTHLPLPVQQSMPLLSSSSGTAIPGGIGSTLLGSQTGMPLLVFGSQTQNMWEQKQPVQLQEQPKQQIVNNEAHQKASKQRSDHEINATATEETLQQPIRETEKETVDSHSVGEDDEEIKVPIEKDQNPPTVKTAKNAEDLDLAFAGAIQEEIDRFADELQEFEESVDEKLEDSYVEGEEDKDRELIGNQDEMEELKNHTESVHQGCVKLSESTETSSADVDYLKENLLEGFAMFEEARMRSGRHIDQRHLALHQRRPLDPESTDKRNSLRTQYQQLVSTIRDVNCVLDSEWDEQQKQQKQHRQQEKGYRHLTRPALDSVYRSLKNHHNIATSQMRAVKTLAEDMHKLQLISLVQPWKRKPVDKFHGSQDPPIPTLDSLLEEGGAQSHLHVLMEKPGASRVLPPKKQMQLHHLLTQIQTTPVRRASPVRYMARQEAEERIREITAKLESLPTSLSSSTRSSHVSLAENDDTEADQLGEHLDDGMNPDSAKLQPRQLMEIPCLTQPGLPDIHPSPLNTKSSAYGESVSSVAKSKGAVTYRPQQITVASSSATGDHQVSTQMRPAFQAARPSVFSMVSKASGKQQDCQPSISQMGSTIQYGAPQHSSAQQPLVGVKQTDTKTGHANPPPEAATMAAAAAVAVAGQSMQFDKSLLPTSKSSLPTSKSKSGGLPPYNSSMSGDSINKDSQPGFAQYLANTTTSTVVGGISSGIETTTTTTTATANSSQLESTLTSKVSTGSGSGSVPASVVSQPFMFESSSLNKAGSLSNPLAVRLGGSQAQSGSSSKQSLQLTIPGVFTSTSNTTVSSTPFHTSVAACSLLQDSGISGGFGMTLDTSTSASTGFPFNPLFGVTSESGQLFAFGSHTGGPQVSQDDPKLPPHNESSSHRNVSSVPNSDSGSDVSRKPPPPYRESAAHCASDKLGHPPDGAENVSQQCLLQPPTVSSTLAPVIPGISVPSNTSTSTNTVMSKSADQPSKSQPVASATNLQGPTSAAIVTVTASEVSHQTSSVLATEATTQTSVTGSSSNPVPSVSSATTELSKQPTTGVVAPLTRSLNIHEGHQAVNIFASRRPGSDNKIAQHSATETQISSTTADGEGDEMADVELDMGSDFTGLGSLGLGHQSGLSSNSPNPFLLKKTEPSFAASVFGSGTNSQFGISGATSFGGSNSGASAPLSGQFSQTGMTSNVGIAGFGIPQGQSTNHTASGFGQPPVFDNFALRPSSGTNGVSFGAKPSFGNQASPGTGLQGRVFGSTSGYNQPNSGSGSNLFGELANQAGQQQGFGALATAGAQRPVFGSGQQTMFGNSSSAFGQSQGGSMFGSGQMQATGQFGASTEADLFGSQPLSPQSSAFTARRK